MTLTAAARLKIILKSVPKRLPSTTPLTRCSPIAGCPPHALDIPQENVRKSHDPVRHTLLDISALRKKSSVEENSDCREAAPADTSTEAEVDEQKEKIKDLQTKIHKNLLKLFHRIKQKKMQEMAGDRKDLGNLDDPGKTANMVSDKVVSLPFVTGVLKELHKTKSQDSEPNAPQNSANSTEQKAPAKSDEGLLEALKSAPNPQNSSGSSPLKALDKVVSHLLQNSSEGNQQKAELQDALKQANKTGQNEEEPKQANQTELKEDEPKEDESEASKDPYAAIAAGPDHPKLPPAVKAPDNEDTVAPPISQGRPKETSAGMTGLTPICRLVTLVWLFAAQTS